MIGARQHPLGSPLVLGYARLGLMGHFAAVRVQVLEPDASPASTLLHATHVSWWDGHLALAVADRMGLAFRVMMLEPQLRRYDFLRFAGAFGFRPGEAHSVRDAIRYAAQELTGGEPKAVTVFPAGEIHSSLRRPLPYHPGAASIALHAAERAPLRVRAVAWRLEHRGEAKPEAVIRVGAPRVVHAGHALRELAASLRDDLEATTDALEADLRSGSLEAYRPALRGLPSAQEGWDRVRAHLSHLLDGVRA